MSKLKIVDIDKLSKSSLQKGSFWKNREVRGLNKFLQRIENGLNKTIRNEIKNVKQLEELKLVTTECIKTYPFKIGYKDIEEKFYNILEENYIKIDAVYTSDRFLTMIKCLFLGDLCNITVCDVTLDVEKTLKKAKQR